MIVKSPTYTKHSEYLGKVIYKRKHGTGSHGGLWMTESCMFTTLKRAKLFLEFYFYKHEDNK